MLGRVLRPAQAENADAAGALHHDDDVGCPQARTGAPAPSAAAVGLRPRRNGVTPRLRFGPGGRARRFPRVTVRRFELGRVAVGIVLPLRGRP